MPCQVGSANKSGTNTVFFRVINMQKGNIWQVQNKILCSFAMEIPANPEQYCLSTRTSFVLTSFEFNPG